MIKEYQKKANIGMGVALSFPILMLIIPFIAKIIGDNQTLSLILMLFFVVYFGIAALFYIYGCRMYAKAKGRNPNLGYLGVFLSIIGLIILVCMEDQSEKTLKEN